MRGNLGSAAAIGRLGLAYHADMFYREAELCYRQAESLAPEEWWWAYYRALARHELGQREELLLGMRRVLQKSPRFGPALWRLGDAEFKNGNYEAADSAWRKGTLASDELPGALIAPTRSLSVVPSSAHSQFGLARLALLKGNGELAREILETLVAKVPNFGRATRLLGDAYAALNRPVDSARMRRLAARLPGSGPYVDPMLDALARESSSSTFLLQQAAIVDRRSDPAWSEYLIRRAVASDSQNADALYELGTLLQNLGRPAEALDVLMRHHDLAPDDVRGLAAVGACLIAVGRFAEAEGFLRTALQYVDQADIHYNLGLALAAQDRPKEAIAAYQLAIDRDRYHTRAYNNLATTMVRQGELQKAKRLLQEIVALDAENAPAHTNLGVVFMQLGRVREARVELREALRIDPREPRANELLREISQH